MAQTMRAILLARATAASLRGLRSSNFSNHAEAIRLPGLATLMTAIAPTTSNWRSRSLPALLIFPSRCLPPLDRSFGVKPSHAAKCRPEAKWVALTVSARLNAPIGPTPGTAASMRLSGLALCCRSIRFSSCAIWLSSCVTWAARNANMSRAACGMVSSLCTAASNSSSLAMPLAATAPNSAA